VNYVTEPNNTLLATYSIRWKTYVVNYVTEPTNTLLVTY